MQTVKSKKAFVAMLLCLMSFGCFKKLRINENALLHQRACIESIELKDYSRAETHCELCLEYDSSMPECLNGIGLIALLNKDEEKAIRFFTKALRQDNDFSQARNNLGVIYFSRADFDKALRYFSRALEIDPSNTDARYNAGLCHFRIGQRLRANSNVLNSKKHLLIAKEQIKKLVAIEPTYYNAFRDLGLIDLNLYDLSTLDSVRQELLATAKQAFNHCKEADSEQDGCYEGLAQVFLEEGRFDQSFANYFLCLNYAPNNSACRTGIATAYEKSAQAQAGYQSFSKTVANAPNNAEVHEAFCATLFERGLDKEGLRECETALRLKPDLCSAQFRLAEYFAAQFFAERAVKHCQAYLVCEKRSMGGEIEKCQEILISGRS